MSNELDKRILSESSISSIQASTLASEQSPISASGNNTLASPSPSEKVSSIDSRIVPTQSPELLEEDKILKILSSDSAIESLLTRLKRSINTCEEFGKYIKKRAILEEDHGEHFKKISRATIDLIKNPQTLKNDSFMLNFDKLLKLDERLAQHEASYTQQLFQMYEELSSLGNNISRNRKSIKENFKRKEREVVDAISFAEKAKSKYDSLCSELERVRTTDPSKKTFTLKGSKTTSEQEEILQRKIDIADSEYRQRVSTATGLRNVFLNTFRPNTANELKDLIVEIDIAMSVQLQRYATRSEDLILQKGLSISPIHGSNLQSAKAIASSINNERDLYQYILKNANPNVSNKQLIPVEYRKHPSIQSNFSNPLISNPKPIPNVGMNSLPTTRKISTHNESPFSTVSKDPVNSSHLSTTSSINSSVINGPRPMSVINNDKVPLPPGTSSGFKTFGTPISELIEFEGEMVPSLVRQCIYVVDKYGLELEGIYRTSGNQATVKSLKELIDKDPSNIKLILPNPNSITDSDIYAVASLLKNFFSSLPEALLTNESSKLFLEYSKIPEPEIRLKKIHQVVYELPDGSYWTLRSLIFHLSKVTSKQDINLMNSRNLGIIWGPTLFPKENFSASDMNYQGKVIEELIIHSNDIFEAE